ncbi:MAG: HlyD family type I secretion periplasmic adaptor subunit [Cohaesibacter sp.]|jgi:adhesin transport system membrane fusion protein|nr:HlyD family type I secretion periplasmic adaptor subunit [Cohaesibacter sp.]
MPDLDELYANDIRQAVEKSGNSRPWLLLLTVVAMFAALTYWASKAQLEEVARGDGQFVAAEENQQIQSLYPGIVAALHVREGEQVSAGQDLISIDDTNAASELAEVKQRIAALRARALRLTAEVEGKTRFDPQDRNLPADLQVAEQALFMARRDALQKEEAIAKQQLSQRQFELEEARSKVFELEQVIELTRRELDMANKLRKSGAMPELQLIRLQRQAQGELRERAMFEAGIPRIEAAIAEGKAKLVAILANYVARAREELTKTTGEVRILEQSLTRLQARVNHATLKAPKGGVVNALKISTIGAVVQQGDVLAEIVPVDDQLVIEARIRPQDVAFIRPGLKARVKVTAYDYTIYGDLPGVVNRISADTIEDRDGQIYYQVIIAILKNEIENKGKYLPVKTGMVASVDILTGSKTILDYLLKPIKKAKWESFRER